MSANLHCSVIVPTVGRDTLQHTINSIVQQEIDDWNKFEIIIVNDSAEALSSKKWNLPGIKHKIVNTHQSGVSFACNTGAALARGVYLKFLHDDDYLLPGGLQALIEVANDSNATWVVGGQRVVDEQGIVLFEERANLSGNIFARFAAGNSIHLSRCLIKRDDFIEVGGFDPQVKRMEDRDLACRMSHKWNFVSTKQLVACILKSNSAGSMFQNQNEKIAWSRTIREKALNLPNAVPRLLDSVKDDNFTRGWIFRGYLFSAVLNLRDGKIWMAMSRLTSALRIAGVHMFRPTFWRGVGHRFPIRMLNK